MSTSANRTAGTPAAGRRAARIALAVVTGVVLLGGCGLRESPVTTGAPPTSPPSATEPVTVQEPEQPPATTLSGAPFSGYREVSQAVVPWGLTCPPDFAETTPDAATMGTASRELADGNAQATRQVAVFADVDAAVAAADALGALSRDRCAGTYEPMEDFVAATTAVAALDVGAQGVVLDTTAEDGAYSTAVFRRGTAVALVSVSKSANAGDEVDPAALVRSAAGGLFVQLCEHDSREC